MPQEMAGWGQHPSHPHPATRASSSLRGLFLDRVLQAPAQVELRLQESYQVSSKAVKLVPNQRALLRASTSTGFTAGMQQEVYCWVLFMHLLLCEQ